MNSPRPSTSLRSRLGLDTFPNILGFLVCILGVVVAIHANFAGRSLFADEAAIVYSILNRPFWGLGAGPLPYLQTAPILWMAAVKCVTLVFGSSEVALRSFSVFSYALTLLLTAWTGRRFFRIRHSWLVAASLANLLAFLTYATVVKPYEWEAAAVLLTLAAHALFREKRLPWWGLALAWLILLLGANPPLFFIGACLLHDAVSSLRQRDFRGLSVLAGVAALSLVPYAVYYIWWLRDTANSSFMQSWWASRMLSPWPPTPAVLGREFDRIMGALMNPVFGKRAYTAVWLFLGASVAAFFSPDSRRRLLPTALLLALVACALKSFPLDLRLWVFALPPFCILVFGMLSDFAETSPRLAVPALILMVTLALGNLGIWRFADRENVYWLGEELNPLLDHIRDHRREGDAVYVMDRAIPGVLYHFGYDFEGFSPEGGDVIWGSNTWNLWTPEGILDDARKIETAGRAWLVLIPVNYKTGPLVKHLERVGTVTEVFSDHLTPLYLFERNPPGALPSAP